MVWYHKIFPKKTHQLTRTALVGGCYFLLTVLPPFYSLAYGPIQVRVAEALTVLPFLFPEATWGLTIGCLVANCMGSVGIIDCIFGPLCTFIAGYLTSRVSRPFWAPLPPVLVNAFGVSIYLSLLFHVPYLYTVLYVMLGEIIACYGLGLLLLTALHKANLWKGVKQNWALKSK